MSDNAPEQNETAPAEVEQETTETVKPAEDLAAEVAKWKSLARQNEKRAKENAAKALKFDEIEEANKSELAKLMERAQAAEAKIADMEARALKAEVAAVKGVPVDLLVGSTQEELEAYADRLLAFRGETKPADFGGGNRGTDIGSGKAQIRSRDELKGMSAEQIAEAKAEGRLDDLLAGRIK